MAYARQARFPALPRFRGALYFLRSEEQRSEQAKPKSEAGGKARRSSFILPPSPYSYNNTLRSCYNGGSLRSCSSHGRGAAASVRPRDSLPASPLASSPSVPPIYRLFYCPLPRWPRPPPPTRGPCHIQLSLLFPPECQSQKCEVKTPCMLAISNMV